MSTNRSSSSQIERYLSIAPVIIALVIGLGIPASYLAMKYEHERAAIQAMSRIHGSMVIDAINKNPDMWKFEEHTLNALVENRVAESEAAEQLPRNQNRFSIVTLDGEVLAENTDQPPPAPLIKHDTPLFDATQHVGFFRVEDSMREVLIDTTFLAAICGLLGLYVALSLRTLPLKALRTSYAKLFHLAHHDSLTGLPNRKFLQDKLESAISISLSYPPSVLLLFIDLDNFKDVNDSLGHASGDKLLRTLGRRILSSIRASDTLSRLGGDEFIILIEDYPDDTESIEALVNKIRSAIAQPVALSGKMVKVTSSVGVARYPEDGTTVVDLLRAADLAMYDAKSNGRDAFSFYSKELSELVHQRLEMNEGIARALTDGEFRLAYQTQVDQKTKKTIGVEALIRWEHPEQGNIPPSRFIPRAEESGAIIDVGGWVLNEACRQNRRWQLEGHPPITVSVNVSAKQFSHEQFLKSVEQALVASDLDPQYLELEITESLLMADATKAFSVMKDLKKLGIKFAIDDFGTGYSSFSYLKKFPVSTLKIDKSFIDGICSNQDDESITRVIIALGHQLNMRVVAEGVETAEQLAFLNESHCDVAQGYYFCRPVSPERIFEANSLMVSENEQD
ncbi:EAL domain-containing protein [Marinobacter sp.]|uniref:putative bifunctional diguanylate cyclase/phosphodiesterase n=1 Tax=Marinobacter sp. TaxID=50741 RepID=UPI002353DFDE|nr:EAL domain-containing protein [Marinobacter sp.]